MTSPTPEPNQIPNLAKRLGPEALGWFLNADASTVRAWAEGSLAPPRDACTLGAMLYGYVERTATHPASDIALASALAAYLPDDRMTAGALIRQRAGGSIKVTVTSSDPIATPLLELAAQLAGVHLLLPASERRALGGAHAIFAGNGHPLADSVRRAVETNVPIDQWTGEDHLILRSSGGGSELYLEPVASQLLSAAAFRWQLSPHWPSLDAYFNAVIAEVDDLKRVLNGRTARVPAICGIAGVRLPEAMAVELPWGRLRPLRPHEKERLPDSPAETILETTFPLKAWLLPVGGGPPDLPDAFVEALGQPRTVMRDTVFAFLLTGLRPPPATINPTYVYICDPMNGRPTRRMGAFDRRVPCVPVPDALIPELVQWASDYKRRHRRTLDVAVRRCVSAVCRDDMNDAFVDAVIGWENLFGSANEALLRISISFGRLLGTDAASRRAISKRVKEDYELRSQLVHGARAELPASEVAAARDRALELLLDGLRALYGERHNLIALNSGERSQALLLDDDNRDEEGRPD